MAKAKVPAKPKSTSKSSKAKVPPEIDPDFAPVMTAFAKDADVVAGTMMASVGLKVLGKIFAMSVKGRFVAKLPKARVDELVRSGAGDYFDPGHGRLMKEWIAMRPGTGPYVALAKEAYRHVKAAAST